MNPEERAAAAFARAVKGVAPRVAPAVSEGLRLSGLEPFFMARVERDVA